MASSIRFVVGLLAGLAGSALRAEPAGPVASPFAGAWLGKVTAPNGVTDLGFDFTPTAQGLRVALYMPEMAVEHADFGPAAIAGNVFTLPDLDTTLARHDGRLVGVFAIPHLPVELHRVDRLPTLPPEPDAPAGPAATWRVALHAEIWASPVISDGIVYVGTADGKFHARAASDGRERWTWSGPNPLYGTALIADRRIYVVDARNELVCLNQADGQLAWRRALADSSTTGGTPPVDPTFTHRTATPVLIDGTLYLGSASGLIYALDAATGAVQWRHDAHTKIYAPAGIDGSSLLFGGLDGTVLAIDRRTHRETARTQLPRAIASTPVASGDTILVGSRDYLLYGLRRSDLSVAWRDSYWFSWVESTPTVVDGVAYLGGSDYARITALNPSTGVPRWVARVHGITWGTPVVTTDSVYAGTQAQANAVIPHRGGIVALDRATGAVKWRIPLPLPQGAERAGIIGSLTLAGNQLIAAQFDGTLAAYPTTP